MCGIVGYIGSQDASPILTKALKRLEYRGYDSAGIAVMSTMRVEVRCATGKLANLEALPAQQPVHGSAGIGHTRWAIHGAPEVRNAHPHTAGADGARVSVVHNGIIENHGTLRERLQAQGAVFLSDTDTEVICHLAAQNLAAGLSPREAAVLTFRALEGSFAAALLFEGDWEHIYASRRGSPLLLGRETNACFIGSDAIALAPMTRNVTYLEEGDFAVVSRHGFEIVDAQERSVRLIAQERQQLRARQLLAEYHSSVSSGTMQLKYPLGQVEADDGYVGHGCFLLP